MTPAAVVPPAPPLRSRPSPRLPRRGPRRRFPRPPRPPYRPLIRPRHLSRQMIPPFPRDRQGRSTRRCPLRQPHRCCLFRRRLLLGLRGHPFPLRLSRPIRCLWYPQRRPAPLCRRSPHGRPCCLGLRPPHRRHRRSRLPATGSARIAPPRHCRTSETRRRRLPTPPGAPLRHRCARPAGRRGGASAYHRALVGGIGLLLERRRRRYMSGADNPPPAAKPLPWRRRRSHQDGFTAPSAVVISPAGQEWSSAPP